MSLESGVVDRFEAEGMRIVGPTQAAARIETSKAFAKALMLKHGIPTGRAEVFSSYGEAREYVGTGAGTGGDQGGRTGRGQGCAGVRQTAKRRRKPFTR